MSTNSDSITMDLFRRVVGMRLERVHAHRYPGYLAYSEVIAMFVDGLSIRIDLTEETVAPLFEVFILRARSVTPPAEMAEWDQIDLGDFIVASVFLLRRKEWVEKRPPGTHQSVGLHGMEQKFGSLADGDNQHNSAIVDSGVSFISMRGAELSLDADTFPLVLQLRYEVAPSVLPQGERIAVNPHRAPQ